MKNLIFKIFITEGPQRKKKKQTWVKKVKLDSGLRTSGCESVELQWPLIVIQVELDFIPNLIIHWMWTTSPSGHDWAKWLSTTEAVPEGVTAEGYILPALYTADATILH